MKKQLLFLSAIFFFLFSNSTGSKSANPYDDDPPSYNIIELTGKLDSSAGINDIEAYFDGNSVYVIFHRDFGYVSITLYAESGAMVYSDVVNTGVQQTVIIPITGVPNGIYTLVLENAFGNSEGDFSKGS